MKNNAPEIKKILVPVSIGTQDVAALKQALIFREVYGAEIILLNVMYKSFSLRFSFWNENLQRQLNKTEKKLKKFTKNFFGGEIPEYVKLHVTSGNLVKEILDVSEKEKCDLIIIKKRKRMASKTGLFKSENADKLISKALCPVITIPEKNTEHNIKDILIPVDITKKVTMKIAWAKYIAERFKVKIHIVSVLDLNIEPLKSLAYRKALKIEESMKEAGLDAEVKLLKTNNRPMHDVVLSHIAEVNPDFVLMMTHQESILFDDYIGKFATEVIHRSPSPVFSLVPRKEMLVSNFIEGFSSTAEQKDKTYVDL